MFRHAIPTPEGVVERRLHEGVKSRRCRDARRAAVASCTSSGQVVEVLRSRAPHVGDLVTLAAIDPEGLPSKQAQLDYARRVDEALACATALQMRATAALAGPAPSGDYLAEVHVETEIALARTISPTAAGLEIEVARTLSSTFPAFLDALETGSVSLAHCRRLTEATRAIVDEAALTEIGLKALPLARRLTPGRFAKRLDALVAELDPDAVARLARSVASSRDCSVQRLGQGLGRLVYVDEWTKVDAVGERIRRAGRATQRSRRADHGRQLSQTAHGIPSGGSGAIDAFAEATDAGSCRADVLLAIVLGSGAADGSVTLDPADVVRVDCQVVIDLETLRGEVDHVAVLNGEPVPGEVGRQWARRAATFRRMVTDPVTGHLLDKGRAYMADDVREFVLHRDGGCRIPGCGVRHRDRLQVDHAIEWPEGPTTASNLGAIDTTHHQLKTHGFLDILDSAADGSALLATLWGQRIVIPPRAFLREPDPPRPAAGVLREVSAGAPATISGDLDASDPDPPPF